MREMAADLEMPTACSSAALVIYHAYRSRREAVVASSAKVQVAWWTVESSACILVSAKVNEVPRKVRDIVNVAHQRVSPHTEPLEVGAAFWDLRDALVHCEQVYRCVYCPHTRPRTQIRTHTRTHTQTLTRTHIHTAHTHTHTHTHISTTGLVVSRAFGIRTSFFR